MGLEILVGGKPRQAVVEFGGLPVLDALPSPASRGIRSRAAAALEQAGLEVPGRLVPDDEGDARRRGAAVRSPGTVAWWLPLISWDGDAPGEGDGDGEAAGPGGGFRGADDHLSWLAARIPLSEVRALLLGGTFDHGRVESEARTPPGPDGQWPRVAVGGRQSYDHDDTVLARSVEALLHRADAFPNLRALYVGELDDHQRSACTEADAAALAHAFPQLTELALWGWLAFRIRPVRHAALRSLRLQGGLPPDGVAALAESRLPALERLELWSPDDFGDTQDPDERAALDGLFAAPGLPALRRLGLRGFTFADAVLRQLADSPVLGRLRELDLSHSRVTDASAELLTGSAVFGGLERLGLRGHAMSREAAERVRRELDDRGVEADIRGGLHDR